ncbi:MAG: hypothetical protein WC848_06230 [Parcubacteria group bacterium]|jgi:hypothetical protein
MQNDKLKFKLFFLVVIFYCFFGLAKNSHAATYYIDYVSGSDSNDGASTSTPWKLAPGMRGCWVGDTGGNCNAKREAGFSAGDRIVLKGGVTWPKEALCWDMYFGGGSTGNPVYIGIDQTWYAGPSWSRPVIDAEGSTIYTSPENVSNTMVRFYNDYSIIDNLEFKGLYQLYGGTNGPRHIMLTTGNYSEIKNCYFHGWGHGGTATADNLFIVSGWGMDSSLHHNVWDGSDTTKDIGEAWYGTTGHVYNNYFAYIQNGGIVATAETVYVWGNTFFESAYNYADFDPSAHHQTFENYGTTYYYNNFTHNIGGGGNVLTYGMRNNDYIFNNVMYNNNTQVLQLGNDPNEGGGYGIYAFNNTMQRAEASYIVGSPANGPGMITVQDTSNNHVVAPGPDYIYCNSTYVTNCTSNNVLAQTVAVATNAGYTSSSTYPYLWSGVGSGGTVNAGSDLSLICSGMTNNGPSTPSADCLSDTTLGVVYDATSHTVTYPFKNPVVRGANWDIGAYEYAAETSDTTPPVAPSGLNVD